jgi:DNA-binding SARP family transcriptional activator
VGSAVEWRVLGPVAVLAGDQELPVGRPQQRGLLGFMLLRAGSAVPLTQLIDALWEAPPATATTQVQACVSGLRRVLRAVGAAGALRTEPAGYRLAVDPGELDLAVFDQRVHQAWTAMAAGRAGEAAEGYRAALALWRGAPLGGAAGAYVDAAAVGLRERMLAAWEALADAELAAGRPDTVALDLRRLCDEHPLREALAERLMLALYRCGRRGDALAAFRRLRQALRDELGVEPGAELAELHRSMLRGETRAERSAPDRALIAVAPTPRQLPVAPPILVGRDEQIEALHALAARRGAPVAVVTGMPGVGKTALVRYWAQRIAGQFPDGQLYADLRGFGPHPLPLPPGDALGGFLVALGIALRRLPAGTDARASLFRELLTGRRVLVVLDNAASADQVRPLLAGTSGSLTVVTSRRALSGLVTAEGAEPLPLAALSLDQARELMLRRVGPVRAGAAPEAIEDIVAACARLPLALTVVAARAASHPHFPLAALATELRDDRLRLDALAADHPATEVRAVLSWSYGTLSAPAARLFRLLGNLPAPEVTPELAASITALPHRPARTALAELAAAHLVEEYLPGRFRLHELLHAYATELTGAADSGADRRAATERILDHYLHAAHAASLLLYPELRLQDWPPIPLEPPAAGTVTARLADRDEAVRWFTVEQRPLLDAVRLATASGRDLRAWQLAATLVAPLDLHGRWHELAAAQGSALAASHRLGDPTKEAACHAWLAYLGIKQGQFGDADEHLWCAADLFDRTGDRIGEAHTALMRSWLRERQARFAEALGDAGHALALFEQVGHRLGQARSLINIGWSSALLDDHRRALACCGRVVSDFLDVEDRRAHADAWDCLGYTRHRLGQHRESIVSYRRAVDLRHQVDDPYFEADTLTRLGDVHRDAGDLPATRAAWQRAVTVFADLGYPEAEHVRSRLDALPC